jgi:hypothetical protein
MSESSDQPSIDLLSTAADQVVLVLTASLCKSRQPEYRMVMQPINIDRVDILQSLLLDTQEEIKQLRHEVDLLKSHSLVLIDDDLVKDATITRSIGSLRKVIDKLKRKVYSSIDESAQKLRNDVDISLQPIINLV